MTGEDNSQMHKSTEDKMVGGNLNKIKKTKKVRKVTEWNLIGMR
jgi:hypothetical protein